MKDGLELNLNEGVTLVNRYDNNYNVQFIDKDAELGDLVIEIRHFLLACGYTKASVDRYIEEF